MSDSRPKPPKLSIYVDSPRFAQLARLLKRDQAGTVQFIKAVRQVRRRAQLKTILRIVTEYHVTTPEEVVAVLQTASDDKNDAEIAHALGMTPAQTAQFLSEVRVDFVRKQIRFLSKKRILQCIVENNARTPEQVVDLMLQHKVRSKPPRSPRQKTEPKVKVTRYSTDRHYVWDPDTGKFKPRSLPDPEDLHW